MSKKRLMLVTVLSVIGVILLAIGSSYALFTFNVTKNSNFKAIVGNLELSISDTNSEDRIVLNNLEPKKDSVALAEDGYTFTITNTGSVDAFYTVYLDDIIPTGETKERIPDSMMKVNLTVGDVIENQYTSLVSDLHENMLINGILSPNSSKKYTLRLWLDYSADNSNQNKYYASKIRADATQVAKVNTLKDRILIDNRLITKPAILSSRSDLVNENGLFKLENITNGFGGTGTTSYYFRGSVINNYVSFAGKLWRIVRINEDGTVRLILNGMASNETTQFLTSKYYSENTDSVKKNVEDWYNENIVGTNLAKIASGNYFCESAKVSFYKNAIHYWKDYIPDLNCNPDNNEMQYVNLSIGLLNYDEYVLAGGSVGWANYSNDNDKFYLGRKMDGWFTMTPDYGSNYIWFGTYDNYISIDPTAMSGYGRRHIRPVINLKADTRVIGEGTYDVPYAVVD